MTTQALKPRWIRHWWAGATAAGQANARRISEGHRSRPVYRRRYGFLEQSSMAREMDHL